jgi:hypothetical protein
MSTADLDKVTTIKIIPGNSRERFSRETATPFHFVCKDPRPEVKNNGSHESDRYLLNTAHPHGKELLPHLAAWKSIIIHFQEEITFVFSCHS